MIYTITLNPSLDYLMEVNSLKIGSTNRSNEEMIRLGGKGLNVSAVLSRLGYESIALGMVAGFVGDEIQRLAEKEGIKTQFIHLEEGCSRINIKLKGINETEINGAGPMISSDAIKELFDELTMFQEGDVLILSGSIPISLPANLYETILNVLKSKKVMSVVDATGELLLNTLKYHPFLIKPNLDELSSLVQRRLHNKEEIIEAMQELKQRGAVNVLVSRGRDGAILMNEQGDVFDCRALSGDVVDSVGAGDSMVAAYVAGYLKTGNELSALNLAVAAGCACAFSDGLPEIEDIRACYEKLLAR